MKHLIAIFAVLGILSPLPAQESAAELVRRLNSASYAEREQAARKLEALGKSALPVLNQAIEKSDLETKRRAAVIIERIEARLLFDELVTATPLHFKVRDMPADEALREFERQTGVRIGVARRKERISVDIAGLPLWQAWRELRKAASLEEADYTLSAAKLKPPQETTVEELRTLLDRRDFDIAPHFSTPRVEFAPAVGSTGFATDDRHSIRVRVKAMESLVVGKTPHMVFAVEMRAEPRLDIVAMPKVELTKIVDATGRARDIQAVKLLPEAFAMGESADFLAGFIGEIQYGGLLHLRMVPLPDMPGKLRELHGQVRVQVQVRPRMLEVPNVLGSVGKEVRGKEGVTLKVLEAVRTEEGGVHLRLFVDQIDSLTPKTLAEQVVRVRPGVVALRGAMDVALERLQLYDRMGRTHERTIIRYSQAKNGKGYEAEVAFAGNGSEARELTLALTYEPRKMTVQMPFVVRDLELPR